ncbi:MAG: peptidylprolyl isomerase, partial [Xanthobacteraceae bacterium]|nr:peptidylprolyl isomerase [Xanthobacteraceae bacterium]
EAAAGDADVVARAGSARLTAADVRALIAQMTPRDRAAVERDPRVLSQTVRALLANQLVLKEALAKKWDQQPAVAAQLQRVHDEALVQTYLRSLSQPPDGFPGDSEVETAYEANKTSFLVPRQFQLAQIFIAQGPDADKAAEEKAKKKLEEVRKSLKEPGANFASIAARESDDPEGAAKGGDLGWLRENQIRPEIKSQIFGLAVNAVSEPVRIEDGWHVFKLTDTKPAYTLPLSEVRELLQQRLREDRQNANQRRFLGKVADENPMTINEIALSKLIEAPASSSK